MNNRYKTIGYTIQADKLWTVEITTEIEITNKNMHLEKYLFRLLSIEDESGKTYKKVPNYSIGNQYSSGRIPIHVHFDKINAKFYNFYKKNYDKYSTYTGVIHQYHENGILHFEYFLNNGKINGNFRSYYSDGSIEEDSFFVDGIRHGTTKIFNKFCYYKEFTYRNIFDITCVFDNGNLVDSKIDNFSKIGVSEFIAPKINDITESNIVHTFIDNYYRLDYKYIIQEDEYGIERFTLDSYKIEIFSDFVKYFVEKFITNIPFSVGHKEYDMNYVFKNISTK